MPTDDGGSTDVEQVPQPLRASLSLRNIWLLPGNFGIMTEYLRAGFGGNRGRQGGGSTRMALTRGEMTAGNDGTGAEDRDLSSGTKGDISSAAASCVAFPAEHLAAARGFGNMTDYLKAREGKQKAGRATRGGLLLAVSRGGVKGSDAGVMEDRTDPSRVPRRCQITCILPTSRPK